MSIQLWETLKESIIEFTGLPPATVFTVVAAVVVLYYAFPSHFGSSDDTKHTSDEHMRPLRPPVQLGDVTEEELRLQYDGSDPEKSLLMAIKGQIYDVSQSRMFYGPGGPNALFTGKDASRALAKMSFDQKDLNGDKDSIQRPKILHRNPQAMDMEETDSHPRKWEEMHIDMLVEIFQYFDIFELISGIGQVCRTWRHAACDPIIWQSQTLDLSMMKSNFIKTRAAPFVYVDGPSNKALTRVLKISLSLSRRKITTLIFHYNLFISNDQLTYTAERCPHLKRLVMPAWDRIGKSGITKAISTWRDLESLTLMPSISSFQYLIEDIAKFCKNFAELKIMGLCDINFALTLAAFLPSLKVLSIRCSMLYKDALDIILNYLTELEVLNISHCVIIEYPPPAPRNVLKELDDSILERARRLKKFLTCMSDTCITCQRTRDDEGLVRWYKYEPDFWKVDEVKSLAI